MLRSVKAGAVVLILCAIVGVLSHAAQAGTILKLGLGTGGGVDIEYADDVLKTTNDGDTSTPGDQNTAVQFLDFLNDADFTDIPSGASFSMNNLVPVGPPTTFFDQLMIQNFTGGTAQLYSPTNELLLSTNLGNSALTGSIGPPAIEALFTTTFTNITGGTLKPLLFPNSLTLSMNLMTISNGTGFTISEDDAEQQLDPFEADARMIIAARPIPEPATALLFVAGVAAASVRFHRRRWYRCS